MAAVVVLSFLVSTELSIAAGVLCHHIAAAQGGCCDTKDRISRSLELRSWSIFNDNIKVVPEDDGAHCVDKQLTAICYDLAICIAQQI